MANFVVREHCCMHVAKLSLVADWPLWHVSDCTPLVTRKLDHEGQV